MDSKLLSFNIDVINRRNRTDRKKQVIQLFDYLNTSATSTRVASTSATSENKTNAKDTRKQIKIYPVFYQDYIDKDDLTDYEHLSVLEKGPTACSCSHFNLWSEIQEFKIIEEDDIIKDDNFNQELYNIVTELSNDDNWDICMLSRNIFGPNESKMNTIKKTVQPKSNLFFIPEELGYGTHQYIIHKRAQQKIKDKMYPIKMPIDVQFNEWHKSGVLNFYVTRKQLSKPIDFSDSDTSL